MLLCFHRWLLRLIDLPVVLYHDLMVGVLDVQLVLDEILGCLVLLHVFDPLGADVLGDWVGCDPLPFCHLLPRRRQRISKWIIDVRHLELRSLTRSTRNLKLSSGHT